MKIEKNGHIYPHPDPAGPVLNLKHSSPIPELFENSPEVDVSKTDVSDPDFCL